MYPAYLESYQNGKLNSIIEKTFKMLQFCSICPRKCKINRLNNEKGFCRTGLKPKVCSFMPHHGEEPPISGKRGSGTIFFSCCNMACVYCQNYEFSQLDEGKEVEFKELADFMLQLQDMGCHNINLVTPTHVLPQILKALLLAIPQGLKIPLVYNTGGYELPWIIKLLDGIVDIYLPDMRYAENAMALKYSQAPNYPVFNQASLREMQRQVGVARMDEEGIIKRGVIIRHLVLPNDVSGTDKIMHFIARELSADSYISLMSQYSPYYKADQMKEIARRISYDEYQKAKQIMRKYTLSNGWMQESAGLERFAGIHIKPLFDKND
jgi:putative pyruvate formate lyase activating enzyme